MGGRFEITIVADDSLTAEQHIDTIITEITRIEYLISDWIPTTQVSQINKNAGIAPVRVSSELLELTERALYISEITNGAFDISFAAMEKIWRYDGTMQQMPHPDSVKKARAKVGYKNIIIDREASTIFLKLPGMKIGFGALGEGYAADRCRNMMLQKGIKAGIINATGDMSTWGHKPDGKPWSIGVDDPFNPGNLYAIIPLKKTAIVTSGSYEKYIILDGKRYSHIINPATGYPATGLISVTVLGPEAERANALSTSIMVMGRKAGKKLIKKNAGYQCIMVTDGGRFYTAGNFKLKRYKV